MSSNTAKSQRQGQLGMGAAIVCSLFILIKPNSDAWSRWLALTAGAASSVALALSIQSSSSTSKESSQSTAFVAQRPRQFQATWNLKEHSPDQTTLNPALVIDFGQDIVVNQPSSGGNYVMQLKRQSQTQVTGLWWFYQQIPAHGTYRGEISADGLTISGAWRMVRSEEEGLWSLTIESTASESLIQPASTEEI